MHPCTTNNTSSLEWQLILLPLTPPTDSITARLCHHPINTCKTENKNIDSQSNDSRTMAFSAFLIAWRAHLCNICDPSDTELLDDWLWCAGKTAASEAKWSDLAVAAAAADKPSSGSANPSLTTQQAARRSAHKATSKMLDARSEAEKAAQLQFADAAQWEYEDEYDDSYDDLAPFGNDGIADAEGMMPLLWSASSCLKTLLVILLMLLMLLLMLLMLMLSLGHQEWSQCLLPASKCSQMRTFIMSSTKNAPLTKLLAMFAAPSVWDFPPLTLAVEQEMMKAALPILDPSPGLGVQSPQASQHQAAHQQDSSSSRRAASPASNGCWTAGSTTTSKLPLQLICTSSCMSVWRLSPLIDKSTCLQPHFTIISMCILCRPDSTSMCSAWADSSHLLGLPCCLDMLATGLSQTNDCRLCWVL